MKGNYGLIILALTVLTPVPAGMGFGGPQAQLPRVTEQAGSQNSDSKDSCLQGLLRVDRAELQNYIDACYCKLMASYACAALQGGEVEKKAKDDLERFYEALHNNTTTGIDKVFKKANEQGCKQKSSAGHPVTCRTPVRVGNPNRLGAAI